MTSSFLPAWIFKQCSPTAIFFFLPLPLCTVGKWYKILKKQKVGKWPEIAQTPFLKLFQIVFLVPSLDPSRSRFYSFFNILVSFLFPRLCEFQMNFLMRSFFFLFLFLYFMFFKCRNENESWIKCCHDFKVLKWKGITLERAKICKERQP